MMQGSTRTTLLTDDEAEMVVTACHALAERLRAGRDGDPHIRKVSRKSADSYDRLARRFQTARADQFVRYPKRKHVIRIVPAEVRDGEDEVAGP